MNWRGCSSKCVGVILGFAFLCSAVSPATENKVEEKAKPTGFITPQYSYDTRDFNRFSVYISKQVSPQFQYFSFVHYNNGLGTTANGESTSTYTEQNFRYKPFEAPLDLTAQWNMLSGADNDKLRFGFRWNLSGTSFLADVFGAINMKYFVNFHILQLDALDGFNWQVEHTYTVAVFPDVLDKRVNIVGWLDHYLGPTGSQVISEHLVGVRLVDRAELFTELRYNTFLAKDKFGAGFGLRYAMEI